MKLDHNKEYVYRNGEKPWKIIFDVPGETYSILSITKDGNGVCHISNGQLEFGEKCDLDLIEVKPKIKGWVNVYKHSIHDISCGGLHSSKQHADNDAMAGRIGCIYIDITEGEGL